MWELNLAQTHDGFYGLSVNKYKENILHDLSTLLVVDLIFLEAYKVESCKLKTLHDFLLNICFKQKYMIYL